MSASGLSTLGSRVGKVLRGFGSRAVDLVYPPQCVACGKALGTAHALCPTCWGGMRFIARPFCERLGTPFAVDLGGPLLSPAAMADPPVFARARAAAAYEETARDLVHRLKFSDHLPLAILMAKLMAQAGKELIADADLLIPVPAHRWRLFRRRFNQSAELAKRLAAETSLPLADDALIKHKATAPQTSLTRAQRRENVSGAFSVPKEKRIIIEGRRVLLIDDVITTGSTANAASRILLRAGAKQVDVLAFAMVVNSA
jgi:ComF family protein